MSKETLLIDVSQITPDCPLVLSIISLHRKCGLKHRDGCFASSCEECLARTFNGYHNHLLPLIKVPEQTNLFA